MESESILPPQVWRDVFPIFRKGWAQRCIAGHKYWQKWVGPVAAHVDSQNLAVLPHIKLGQAVRLYGLVCRSDGHVLRSNSLGEERLPLYPGDMYSLDPSDTHWTECADANGEIHVINSVVRVPCRDEDVADRLSAYAEKTIASNLTPADVCEMLGWVR